MCNTYGLVDRFTLNHQGRGTGIGDEEDRSADPRSWRFFEVRKKFVQFEQAPLM